MSIPVSAYSMTGGAAITGVKLVRTYGTNLKITWDPSEDEYHKKYRLYKSDDAFVTAGTLVVTTTKTDYTDKDAGTGSWSYMVKDLDQWDQESDDSNIVTATVAALLPYIATLSVTSATTIDFMDQIERLVMSGQVENKGPENLLIELSYDGTTYPRNITIEPFTIIKFEDAKDRIAIYAMRLTSTNAAVNVVAS